MISVKHRTLLYFLSAILALGGVAILGSWQPGARLFHRWYPGVTMSFFAFFTILFLVSVRGRLVRSPWVILVAAALSYPAAVCAYFFYFAMFERRLFVKLLTVLEKAGFVEFAEWSLFLPIVSAAWLFGALTGSIYLVLARCLQSPLLPPSPRHQSTP
jgi:hypothetical protein